MADVDADLMYFDFYGVVYLASINTNMLNWHLRIPTEPETLKICRRSEDSNYFLSGMSHLCVVFNCSTHLDFLRYRH